MARPGRYPLEVRERAVRLVREHQHDYPSQWAAIRSIAAKCGMTTETLRKWVWPAPNSCASRYVSPRTGTDPASGVRRGMMVSGAGGR